MFLSKHTYHFLGCVTSLGGRSTRMAEGQVQQHYHNNRYQRRATGHRDCRQTGLFSDRRTQPLIFSLSDTLEARRHGSEPEPLGVRRCHHQQQ